MCNDQKQLSRKIRTMEDELLRTRDYLSQSGTTKCRTTKNAYSIIENEICRGVNNASFFLYFPPRLFLLLCISNLE